MPSRSMNAIRGVALGAGAVFPVAAAGAGVPFYPASNLQLQARANFTGAFNLPDSAFFTNATPSINESADVAFKMEVISGSDSQGVWYGGNAVGQIQYTSPPDGVLSDPTLNNATPISSTQFAVNQFFTTPTAIMRVEAASGSFSIGVAPGGPFGITSFSGSIINDADAIGFRAGLGIGGQAFISAFGGGQAMHVAEVGADAMSPYSFLFTPAMNGARQIAGKARRGALNQVAETQPDEIRVWNTDGSSVQIAFDNDWPGLSIFSRFDNGVSVNDSGEVAFAATLVAGGRGVFRADGSGAIDLIASTTAPAALQVSDVEFFRPDINSAGQVVFRGRDMLGRQAIFVGDGLTLRRIIGRGDAIATDLGPGMIDQHDASVVFGGAPSINDRGNIAFNCALTPAGNNQVEWGSGVYVAYATAPADLDGDGDVDAADLALLLGSWGPCPVAAPCPVDLNGDGMVNAADLALLLGSWG